MLEFISSDVNRISNMKIFFSTGNYPNCTCNEPMYGYEEEINFCLNCPENSTGTYPDCKCSNALFSKRYGCIKCPANATGFSIKFIYIRIYNTLSNVLLHLGLFPDCECELENHIYSAYINQCYIECGGGSTGQHPHCKCDKPDTHYEPTEFTCKSNIGRECPKASIGTGPDCLCVQKDHVFNSESWTCDYGTNFAPGTPQERCPGGGRWPQCPLDWDCYLSWSTSTRTCR